MIDDDPRVLSVTTAILRRAGYEVLTATAPESALELLSTNPQIAIALVDVVLPGMNGYDLASEIRRVAPPTRIVYMSGFRSDHIQQAVDDLVLPKPFTVGALVATVAAALENLN